MDRISRVLTFTALALTGLVLTAACSGPSATASAKPIAAAVAADGSQQITVTVGNTMSFEPSSIAVKAGAPVVLTLQNTGQTAHDFTLSEGVAQPVKISVAGDQTATSTFSIDKPGNYAFTCSMPGHSMAGMRGTLIAQ